MQYRTIKDWARNALSEVNYVDIWGRRVGFDYIHVLTQLKKAFPNSHTSMVWLRKMAYEFNTTMRMPVRRRSRRILAREYAKALLIMTAHGSDRGYALREIGRLVKKKFPDQPTPNEQQLYRTAVYLAFKGFTVPKFRGDESDPAQAGEAAPICGITERSSSDPALRKNRKEKSVSVKIQPLGKRIGTQKPLQSKRQGSRPAAQL